MLLNIININKLASVTFPSIPPGPIFNPSGGKFATQGAVGNIILTDMIGNFLTAAFGIASVMVLVYLLWGGFDWLTSGGEKASLENARNKISNAVIGIVIIALSVAITLFIGNVLGVSILKLNLPVP